MTGFTKDTKLSKWITVIGEKPTQNSAIWSPTNDMKIAIAVVDTTSGSVTSNMNYGFSSFALEATGILTATYSSQFDALPAPFSIPIIGSGTLGARRIINASDGVAANRERSTTEQTFLRYKAAGSVLENGVFVIGAVGVDAATTNISDNSDQTPLDPESLNRMIFVGNYLNPSTLSDTIFVISCGYTTTGALAGDTFVDISNMGGSYTDNGAGDYSIAVDSPYLVNPMYGIVTIIGADGGAQGYGTSETTVDSARTRTTDGTNAVEIDLNYSLIVVGEMEVS